MLVTLFSALLLISAIGLIVSVVFQESKSEGMGSAFGQSASIWSKSSNDIDSILGRITVISSVVFMISALVLAAL